MAFTELQKELCKNNVAVAENHATMILVKKTGVIFFIEQVNKNDFSVNETRLNNVHKVWYFINHLHEDMELTEFVA